MKIEAKPFGEFLRQPLPVQRDWIGPGLLPRSGGVMIVAGPSKAGKSLFGLELCRALATGDSPFGAPFLHVPEPARVLLIEDEVKEAGVQERGRLVFASEDWDELNDRLYVVSGVPEIRFDNPQGWNLLRDVIQDVQPNVLMLDPIGRLIGGLDENRNDEMGKVLSKLDQILKDNSETQLSLIMTHHTKKPDLSANSNYDPLSPHVMRGSSRWFANPDSIMMLDRRETFRTVAGIKAWKVRAHFETRQSENPDDSDFVINEGGDLRVRYQSPRQKPAPPRLDLSPLKPLTGEQLMFPAGNEMPRLPNR